MNLCAAKHPCKMAKVLFVGRETQGICHRCIPDRLGTGFPICISILLTHPEGDKKDKTGQSQDFNNINWGQAIVVSGLDLSLRDYIQTWTYTLPFCCDITWISVTSPNSVGGRTLRYLRQSCSLEAQNVLIIQGKNKLSFRCMKTSDFFFFIMVKQ